MPVKIKQPKQDTLFDQIAREVIHKRRDLFDTLSDSAKKLVIEWFSDALVTGKFDNDIHNTLWELDYIRKPVSITEFIEDPKYLGHVGESLWPLWKRDLTYIFDPTNRVDEIIFTGAIGSGKCCVEGTLIYTDRGLVPIEEVTTKDRAQTESGYLRNVIAVHDEGVTDVIEIATAKGKKISVRPNHRLRVLRNLDLEWIEAKDIQVEDVLVSVAAEQFGENCLGNDMAELIGWYVAEGNNPYKNTWRFSLHRDELDYIIKLATRAAGEHIEISCSEKHCYVVLRKAECLCTMFPSCTDSHDKFVPQSVLEADRKSVCAFLRGYFSGDGTVDCHGQVSVTTVSKTLVRQISILLTSLGIDNSIREGAAAYTKNGTRTVTGRRYTIQIVGSAATDRFFKEIGFVDAKNHGRIAERIANVGRRNVDHFYGIRLSKTAWIALRDMQPAFRKETVSLGQSKTTTPRGTLHRCRAQRLTKHILRDVIARGGTLPKLFSAFAYESKFFDSVISTAKATAHCYDLSVEDDPSYISDGFISHNTTTAAVSLAYLAYKMSCLRDPAAYFGLIKNSRIVLGVYSVTMKQSVDTGFAKVKDYIDRSPYFINTYPRNLRLDSKVKFKKQNVEIMTGSRSFHELGIDLLGFVLDECNFFQEHTDSAGVVSGEAQDLYSGTKTRMSSRFRRADGTTSGLVMLLSSRKHQTSFLETRLKEATKGQYKPGMKGDLGNGVYLCDYAAWEIQPKERFSKKTFFISVGDQYSSSRILDKDETPQPGRRIITVPESERGHFERDIELALRDIAGVATHSMYPFIRNRQSIMDAIRSELFHPFTEQVVSVSTQSDFLINEVFDLNRVCRVVNSRYVPRMHPGAPRFLHIDTSAKIDATGICMCHPGGESRVRRENRDGTHSEVVLPFVVFDFMLRILPPAQGEIDFAKIRSFVFFLRDIYNIVLVTTDDFQSRDTRQLLDREGVPAECLSVDRSDEAYMALRNAFTEHRVSTYHYQPFIDEMLDLEYDLKKKKVDHPVKSSRGGLGSKDIADGAAGSLFSCITSSASMKFILDQFIPEAQTLPITDGPRIERKDDGSRVITKSPAGLQPQPAKLVSVNGAGLDMNRLRGNLKP